MKVVRLKTAITPWSIGWSREVVLESKKTQPRALA